MGGVKKTDKITDIRWISENEVAVELKLDEDEGACVIGGVLRVKKSECDKKIKEVV